jgi:hypothetical protein
MAKKTVVSEMTDEEKGAEQARIAQEAEEKQLDETVPGGRYQVGDEFVNSEGEPVKRRRQKRRRLFHRAWAVSSSHSSHPSNCLRFSFFHKTRPRANTTMRAWIRR